jgi:threonine dehydratase
MNSLLETTPLETVHSPEADEVAMMIIGCREELDRRFDNLEGYDIGQAELVLVENVGEHTSVAIDISGHPGGAFKYVSALGGALMASEGTETAVTASAGNYSSALGEVCLRLGLQGVAYTPVDTNPTKLERMAAQNMQVHPAYENVQNAMPAAEHDGSTNEHWAFLHPYDNAYGIAALTNLADQVIVGLQKLELDGKLDLQAHDVQILVQRGGGSLLAAMAARIRQAKDMGILGENVTVHEVRPERLDDGSLDPEFDGLKVEEAGSNAEPLLNDTRYVAGTYTVSKEAVREAGRHVAKVTDVPYETNALAGLGMASALISTTKRPTVFVSLLTGRNADPVQRKAFLGTEEEPSSESPDVQAAAPSRVRLGGMALLGGQTQRVYAPLPDARLGRDDYRLSQELADDHYDALAEWGVELLPSSRTY